MWWRVRFNLNCQLFTNFNFSCYSIANNFTGIFLDSAVEGLSYTTATNSGITNTFGEFSYQTNEDVTFSIGDIIFPAFAASSLLTPLAVIETDNINHPSVINVL
jgi:hypothetical protein